MVVQAPEETRLEIPPPTEVSGPQGAEAGGAEWAGLKANAAVVAGEHQGPPEGRQGPHHGGGLRGGRGRGRSLLRVAGGEPSEGGAAAAAR